MVSDYHKDNLVVIINMCTFYLLCQLANITTTEIRYCFETFAGLHDNVTTMVYVDVYSQSMIAINQSSNAYD